MLHKWLRRNLDESAMRWVQPLIIGLLGLVAYLPQYTFPFVYDDVFIISRNPAVRGGPWLDSAAKPYWPREFATDPLYRPVAVLSLRLNYAVFGDRAAGYRVTNAVLHGACSALVALLAMRLWSLGGRRAAGRVGWMAGVLFAVHPIHAEAVALVVGRTELLAALFSLAVLYRHAGFLAGPRTPSVRYHLVSTVLLLLAVGSKESAVATLLGVACLDIWARRSEGPTAGLRELVNRLGKTHYVGMVLAVTLFLLARWLMFGGRTVLPPDQVNPFANPLIQASAVTLVATPPALLALALRLFVVPVGLCPIWSVGGFDLPQTLWRGDVLAGGVLVIAGVVIVVVGLRRRWIASLLIALAGLFLLIPCHFVPAANWLFAERWVYLPSAFLIVLIAGLGGWSARRAVGGWRAALAIVGVVGAALFAVNWQYQQSWRSNVAICQAILARHPFSYQALVGYSQERHKRGELVAAEPYVNRLVERFPDASRTWYYQTLLMDQLDRPTETLEAFGHYIRLSGPNPVPADLWDARNRARQVLGKQGVPSQ